MVEGEGDVPEFPLFVYYCYYSAYYHYDYSYFCYYYLLLATAPSEKSLIPDVACAAWLWRKVDHSQERRAL